MKTAILILLTVAVSVSTISATAGEPPKPTCKVGDKYDDKSKKCVPAP